MHRQLLLAALILGCSSVAGAAPPAPVAITTCGQAVPPRGLGYLTADLDCTGFDGAIGSVMVSRGATLELRGFTLTGGLFGVVCGELVPRPDLPPALQMGRTCKVDGGGGTITGAEAHGVLIYRGQVSDVTITHSGQAGVASMNKMTLENVTITDSGTDGARSDRGAVVVGTTITGSGEDGLHAALSAKVLGSTLTGNGISADCAVGDPCADLATIRRPKLGLGSVCGTSRQIFTPYSWHVCQLD